MKDCNKHRDTHFNSLAFITTMNSSEYSHSKQLPVLGFLILFICPVLHGCELLQCKDGYFTAAEKVPVKMTVHSKTDLHELSLDMLIFSNDGLQHLECWQRIPVTDGEKATIASMNGDKILMACSGMDSKDHGDWMWVSSIESLNDAWTELEAETADMPVLSGSCSFLAGAPYNMQPMLTMRRVSCEVHLRSLRCDFKGKPYEGEKLSGIQVYLTNANASCRIWNDPGTASRIINQGRLVMEDVARFKDPSLIWQKIEEDVGDIGTMLDIRLRCYPDSAQEEGPGTPFTRLVIEGILDGDTWYWPIDINRDGESSHQGLESNCVYTYDTVLTRKGSADPDTAIRTDEAAITMEVEKWEEKDGYSVMF